MTRTARSSSRSNRPATITGRIVDADGNPVSGATIRTDPQPRGDFSLSLPQVASGRDGQIHRARRADRMRLLAGGRERGDARTADRRSSRMPPSGRARPPTSATSDSRRIDQPADRFPRGADSDEPIRDGHAYRPSPSAPWDLARAWTLRRRAGFAATWDELQRDLDDGPDAAVDRVLAGDHAGSRAFPPNSPTTADLLGDAAAGAGDAHRLQAWWLYRMLFTPDPLTERLTLMWHNHFATSQLKVDDVAAMQRQNETFRRHARGPFGDLLRAMLRDPALLVWLDAPSNRKGKPNENLARELMELFTLGVGHYSEHDVKEAARALTGPDGRPGPICRSARTGTTTAPRPSWARPTASTAISSPTSCSSSPPRRDGWRGGCARRSWARTSPTTRPSRSWPSGCARDGLHVGRAVEMILRSELFFSARNLHAQVSEPVGFVDRHGAEPRALRPAAEHAACSPSGPAGSGQELFFPPNVGGWPGGRSWLSGRAVVARANFAAALVGGRLNAGSTADVPDLRSLAARHGRGKDAGDASRSSASCCIGRRLDAAACQAILEESADRTGGSDAERFNRAVALLLSRPEAQLCDI